MTIAYHGNWVRLLFRWKGSIWRSVWAELCVFLTLYFAVKIFYLEFIPRLDPDKSLGYKRAFESLALQFNEYTRLIPLTFLLGFYVSNVVSRWWRQFECLSWPEDILSLLCIAVPGGDIVSQRARHQVARYLNLSAALAWRAFSSKISRRYPTLESLIVAGLLTGEEKKLLQQVPTCAYWLTPLHWTQHIMADQLERNGAQIAFVNNFNSELKAFRASFRRLFSYDWVCVPLVYTQVAALATYAFFGFCLLGRQHLLRDGVDPGVDIVFPVFTVVQFLFFVGWFKVGQDLMRPFGDDDDDFELDYLLDRNIIMSFAMVHQLQASKPPHFTEDPFWRNRHSPNYGIDLHHKRSPKVKRYEDKDDLEALIEGGQPAYQYTSSPSSNGNASFDRSNNHNTDHHRQSHKPQFQVHWHPANYPKQSQQHTPVSRFSRQIVW